MVVLIHTNNVDLFKIKNIQLSPNIIFLQNFICACICTVAVPTFMFISGVLFFFKLNKNFSLTAVKNKFKKNLIPYFTWNIIYFFLFYFLSNLHIINTPNFEINVNNIINGIVFYKYNNAYWFMFQLLLYILLSPLIFIIMKNKFIGFTSILLCFLAIDNITIPKIGFMSLFYYLIGAYIAMNYQNYLNNNYIKSKISTFIFMVGTLLWMFNYYNIINFNNNIITLLMTLSFFFIIDQIKVEKTLENRSHFFVYSLHVIVLEVLEKLTFLFLGYNNFTSIISFILTPILSIFICLILNSITNKYFPKLHYLMTGI